MNIYRLDDKIMDAAFLNGEPVHCRAVLTAKKQKGGIIKEGDTIVVMLSSGSKYKGSVLRFEPILIDAYAMGEIEVVRV